LSEKLEAKWERLWHFFSISQKFGEWTIETKYASEKESILVMKTYEILKKYGVLRVKKIHV
jgi:hypothetical protein